MLKYPPNWQLKKAYLRQHSTLRKKTVAMINDQYEQGIESFTEYPVLNCEIQPVTSEDLVWLQPGILNVGDARGWFKELIAMSTCVATFEDPILYSYDITKIVVVNSLAKLKPGTDPCMLYPITNPTIMPSWCCTFNVPAFSFTIKSTIPTHTQIKFILSGNNGLTWYWWDGAIWALSDGTYSQSNTTADIIAHLSTLPLTSGCFKWKAFLHSDDGVSTPELKEVKMIFGIKIAVDDEVIDHQNKRYHVELVIDYYTKDSILLKECYLKKVVGE
jgi:hypothetical protein